MCSPPHRSFLELTTWSFDWWDIMILILHITMTTAAHSHPPPSEISSGFFWMSVSAPSKYPSPAQAVKEEQILYYISLFFFGLSPSQSIYELKEAKPNVVKDAFFLVWSLSMFFFSSICNILSEECFEVLTPCLFSNITPVALNVYPKNLTNKWLQPQFPLSTVPHCKM